MGSLKVFLCCLLAGILTVACQKEHLTNGQTTTGTPVFYFNGTVGSNTMSFQAGKNNYYMYSSYSQSSSGVYSFTGNLKEYNCTSNCAPSIEFEINDTKRTTLGASANIATSLSVNNYSYYIPGGTSTSDSAIFTPELGGGSVNSYILNFGDGNSTKGNTTPPTTITHTYTHPGNYNTSLTVQYAGGYTYSSNDSIGSGTINPLSQVTITDTVTGSGTYSHIFRSHVNGMTPPYVYAWNFGNGLTSTSASLSNVIDTPSGIYKVTLTVTDNFNNVAITSVSSASDSSKKAYTTNYSTTKIAIADTLGLSNVTVIYTDATGDVYTSNNISQPQASSFQIVSVDSYNNNENNQTTKQLHVKFNCTLYDSTGKTLPITNGDAVIAVAYK